MFTDCCYDDSGQRIVSTYNVTGVAAMGRDSSLIQAIEPTKLPSMVKAFVEESASVCQPDHVHLCDGSERENNRITQILRQDGTIKPLSKYENW